MGSSGTDRASSFTEKALSAACPDLREGEPADAIDGVVPSFVASPADTAEAAALLRAAAEHDLAVVPRGAGSRLGWGIPPSRCDLVVDMLRMGSVLEHAAGDLVARVQAGARMGAIAETLAGAGQEIALDVPDQATAGGIVASGLTGPRRLRYGTPRDLLIGITVVRADGTVAHSGGKVVKNVAGYDLGKLLAGSWGTLGLITEATFRLHPLPAARTFVTASVAGPEAAGSRAAAGAVAAAASSPLVASAVEVSRAGSGEPFRVGVLLEGSADGVAARAERMAGLLGGSAPPAAASVSASVSAEAPDWWPRSPEPGEGTLIQVSFWVSALGGVLDAVEKASRAADVRPAISGPAGAGAVHLSLGPDTAPEAAARLVGALRDGHARGSVVVLAAPAPVRAELRGHGGMNGKVPSLRLMRAVKDQFDPGGRLSPGRFPEGI
ncbi:MAG TPA: FAD-binding oxidoreductase [Trebonia sp.]